MPRRRLNEPVQSDRTILMTVEDLINLAMNTSHHNVVNFKLVQTILHILARQLRLLEQHVYLGLDADEDLDARSRKTSPPRRGRKGRASLSPPGRGTSRTSRRARSKSSKRLSPDGETTTTTTTDEATKKDKKNKDGGRDGSKTARGADTTDSDQEMRKKRGGKGDKSQERKGRDERDDYKGGRRDRDDFERGKRDREHDERRGTGAREGADQARGINIRERDNVLYAEKAPRRSEGMGRVGSIEVATAAQLEALREEVRRLQKAAGPLPPPEMPTDQALRSDLAAGTASLTDTVNALQLAGRVQAAEEAARRLAELVTAVAAAGAGAASLPQMSGLHDTRIAVGGYGGEGGGGGGPARTKSVAISAGMGTDPSRAALGVGEQSAAAQGRPSVVPRYSLAGVPGVTKEIMEDALEKLREELIRNIGGVTSKAEASANMAAHTAKTVSERLDVALTLSQRISALQGLVADYAEQLSGFGGGLQTQMTSFQEQMASMRGDLTAGLLQLDQVNSNKETLAVIELTERYEGLVTMLDQSLHEHGALTADMRSLAAQLEALRAAAEALGEQKADRDEVADGLRDKADLTRLQGLLPETEFSDSLTDLEHRLALCHRKFSRQEAVFQEALKELSNVMEGKADMTAVMSAREEALRLLRLLQQAMQRLELAVGEPKAAMLARQMAKDAACGSCQTPAFMEPADWAHGVPARLPALRPPPTPPPPPDELCGWEPAPPMEDKAHACHRWVGGSHTLLAGLRREPARALPAPPGPPLPPTRHYLAAGDDGRLYKCEDELQPCRECNAPIAAPDSGAGAGDKTS